MWYYGFFWHDSCCSDLLSMVDPLTSKQILSLFAQGSPAEEIASVLNIELPLVELTLTAHQVGDRDITDEQLALLRGRAFSLALQNDDISVAARMTQYLIDRDKPAKPSSISPVIAINNAIIQANQNFEKLKEEYS